MIETLTELIRMLLEHKKYWLLPAVAVLLLAAVLVVFGHKYAVVTFIYALF